MLELLNCRCIVITYYYDFEVEKVTRSKEKDQGYTLVNGRLIFSTKKIRIILSR